jgi:phosphotransferase system  glucose/maltose/N-acetylglucosamine-specific IIC component
MDANPSLTTIVYVLLIVFALLVIAYWVMYTRRLKTPGHVGKNEGIAMAKQQKSRAGKTEIIG